MTSSQEPATRVVFRKWKRGPYDNIVIALFPEEMYSRSDDGTCYIYEHVGQHGSADYAKAIRDTVPATEEEYAALKRELESYPYQYNLRVVKDMGSTEDNSETRRALLLGRTDLRTLAEDKTVSLNHAYRVYKEYFPHGIESIADVLLDRAMGEAMSDDGWYADEDLQKWRRESGT